MKIRSFFLLVPLIFLMIACRTQSGNIKKDQPPNGRNPLDTAIIPDRMKVPDGITGKHWKLIAFSQGIDLPFETAEKVPYIVMSTEGNLLNGSGGCNKISGNFILSKENHISFTGITGTKMACMNMKTEIRLLEILSKTNNYALLGDTLFLKQADSVMARFIKFQ